MKGISKNLLSRLLSGLGVLEILIPKAFGTPVFALRPSFPTSRDHDMF